MPFYTKTTACHSVIDLIKLNEWGRHIAAILETRFGMKKLPRVASHKWENLHTLTGVTKMIREKFDLAGKTLMRQVYTPPTLNLRKITALRWVFPRYRRRSKLLSISSSLVPVLVNAIAARDGRFLFIKNSKCGCTTCAQVIHYWETGKVSNDNVHRSDQLVQGGDHYNSIIDALRDSRAFKFTTVRHPVTRAASAYQNFFLDRSNGKHRKHMQFLKHFGFNENHSAERNFDAFLDYVGACLAENLLQSDSHFRPQFFNTRPDIIDYNMVCRVEHLAEDLNDIASILKLPAPPGIKDRRYNQSEAKYEPNGEQIRKIRKLYAVDFGFFKFDD